MGQFQRFQFYFTKNKRLFKFWVNIILSVGLVCGSIFCRCRLSPISQITSNSIIGIRINVFAGGVVLS